MRSRVTPGTRLTHFCIQNLWREQSGSDKSGWGRVEWGGGCQTWQWVAERGIRQDRSYTSPAVDMEHPGGCERINMLGQVME